MYQTIIISPASFIFPGIAHYIRGDYITAHKISKTYGLSIATFISSVLALGFSGAADIIAIPFIPLTLISAASWWTLAAADLIGSRSHRRQQTPFPHTWLTKQSYSIQYRLIDEHFFKNKHYSSFTAKQSFGTHTVKLDYAIAAKQKINILTATWEHQIWQKDLVNPADGIYTQITVRYENNPKAYYRNTSLTYNLKSQLNFAFLSPFLSNLNTQHRIGVQQFFTKYTAADLPELDSTTGLSGGMEIHWTWSKYFKNLLGYNHDRDTSISILSTGFTGVYYSGFELAWTKNLITSFRNYWGRKRIFDFSLITQF